MYDTSNPYDWKYYKTVDYPLGSWTITDATLSPDNRYLAYSSLRELVCLAPTDPADSSDPTILDLASSREGRVRGDFFGRHGFAVSASDILFDMRLTKGRSGRSDSLETVEKLSLELAIVL